MSKIAATLLGWYEDRSTVRHTTFTAFFSGANRWRKALWHSIYRLGTDI